MTTSTSLLNSSEIEIHEDLSKFTLAQFDWLPEANEGKAFDALLHDIEKNGLIHPVVADNNDCIYDGRLRLLVCQKLRIPLAVRRIKAEDGETAARRGLKHRQMTVLDQVRFVGFIADELTKKRGSCSDRELAEHMASEFGWQYGVSHRQMGIIRGLFGHLKCADDEQKAQMRDAKTVNAALKALKLDNGSTRKKGKRLTMMQIRVKIQEIVNDAREDNGATSTTELIKDLEVLLKQLPESKAKSDKPKANTAKAKKTRSKTTKAN